MRTLKRIADAIPLMVSIPLLLALTAAALMVTGVFTPDMLTGSINLGSGIGIGVVWTALAATVNLAFFGALILRRLPNRMQREYDAEILGRVASISGRDHLRVVSRRDAA